LRVNRVMGFRLGSLAPSMRATCVLSDVLYPRVNLEEDVLFAALVRKTWADLPRYADSRAVADMTFGFVQTNPG
jgi:hypothetical protein